MEIYHGDKRVSYPRLRSVIWKPISRPDHILARTAWFDWIWSQGYSTYTIARDDNTLMTFIGPEGYYDSY